MQRPCGCSARQARRGDELLELRVRTCPTHASEAAKRLLEDRLNPSEYVLDLFDTPPGD